jgi:hypothetical protein
MKNWSWRGWIGLGAALVLVLSWAPEIWDERQRRADLRARLQLPKTEDLFRVSYVDLVRDKDGHLVVFTDASALKEFEGRFKVALRDRNTQRHHWTPQWSEWITYLQNDETKYRQPETLQWWANVDYHVEPPPNSWWMETCWQARVEDDRLGLVELEPVCASSVIDAKED